MRRLVRRARPLHAVLGLGVLLGLLPARGPAQAPPRAVRAARPADDDFFLKQFEQNFGAQFRLLYRTELHFIRTVCQPTRTQFEKLAKEGEPALESTIRVCSQYLRNPGDESQGDPRSLLANNLLPVVRKTLSAEQAARYQKEIELRATARRRAVLMTLLSRMDKLLNLTAAQREELRDVLEKRWRDSWNQTQLLMYAGEHFPNMPDADILPHLTEAQRVVWHGVPKGNIRFGFSINIAQGAELDDETWDNDPPKQPGKAGVK